MEVRNNIHRYMCLGSSSLLMVSYLIDSSLQQFNGHIKHALSSVSIKRLKRQRAFLAIASMLNFSLNSVKTSMAKSEYIWNITT